jgi:hypothetical protein
VEAWAHPTSIGVHDVQSRCGSGITYAVQSEGSPGGLILVDLMVGHGPIHGLALQPGGPSRNALHLSLYLSLHLVHVLGLLKLGLHLLSLLWCEVGRARHRKAGEARLVARCPPGRAGRRGCSK